MKRYISVFAAAVFAAAFVLGGCSKVASQDGDAATYYTVSFCDNGEVLCYQTVAEYGYANKILPPEKYGYDFVCWLYRGEEYDFTTPVTSDISLDVSRELSRWTITFVADGETVKTLTYTVLTSLSDVSVPAVPEKAGYTGVWEDFSLTHEDITVNAVYGAIEYTAKFVADGEEVDTLTFTVEDEELSAPAVPEKTGYEGSWDSYEIAADDMIINAVYRKKTYKVYFYADGELVYTAEYKYGDTSVEEPAVPERNGVGGAWASYELGAEDVIVCAVYPSEGGTQSGGESGGAQTGGETQSGETQTGGESGETQSGETVATSEDDLEFMRVSGGYEVTGLKSGSTLTEVVIPSVYKGSAVVSIGAYAFYSKTNLTKVTILGGVKVINEAAFYYCSSLKEVILPSTLQEICSQAFAYCPFGSITLPDSLITIGDNAFYDCGLITLTLPDSVETVGTRAFYHCELLTEVVIGSSVNFIDIEAFYYCDKLYEAVFRDLSDWYVKDDVYARDVKSMDFSDGGFAAECLREIHAAKCFIKSP